MKENNIDKNRLKIFIAIVVFVGVYLIGGLIWLQLFNGKAYAEKATRNSIRKVVIPATRGVMYDRNGDVVVNSKSGYVISMTYTSKEENLRVFNELADIFIDQKVVEEYNKYKKNNKDQKETLITLENFSLKNKEKLKQLMIDNMVEISEERKHYKPFEPIRLAPISYKTVNEITLEMVASLEGIRSSLPNVLVEIYPERQYKLGNYGFHIIGGLNEVDRVGREGLEKSYDEYLTGKDGMKMVEVNRYNRPTNELGVIPPVKGADLYLTIDNDLQVVAENALLEHMKLTRERIIRESKTKGYKTDLESLPYSGSVVVMDVKTGAIRAMASFPQVDRENYADIWDTEDPFINRFKPGTNWATGASRPAGSILKPLIAIAGLETGQVTHEHTIYCNGVYRGLYNSWRGGYKKYCWDRSGHGGNIEVTAALKNSCNLYFYPLGEKLGLDIIGDYYGRFGFGKSTQFTDMMYTAVNSEGEEYVGKATSLSKGIVVDEAKFKEIYGRKPSGGELASAGIGQGDYRVSPLQIAMYTSMLANGELQPNGKYVVNRNKPYLVEKVVGSNGETIYEAKPTILDSQEVNKDALDAAREGMRKVTQEKGGLDGNTGTAFWSFHKYDYKKGYKQILPFEVAGKTGTAQEWGWENHGWFISYAPYDEPEIAVVILMEQGLSGGRTGAPITRIIYEEYFKDEIAKYNEEQANKK